MPWQVSLLFVYVFTTVQSLWMRNYAKDSRLPASWPPTIAYLIGVMPLSIVAGLLSHKLHIVWNASSVALLATEGAFFAAFNVFQFYAVREMSIVRFRTVFQLYEVVVIILGWNLLHERLDAFQLIGAIVLMIAAWLAIQAPPHKGALPINRRTWVMSAMALLCFAGGQISEKAALHYMDFGMYFIVGFGTQALALLLIAVVEQTPAKWRQVNVHEFRQASIMGLLIVPIGTFYVYALQKSNSVSLITALTAFGLPLTVLASHFILRERENVRLMWSAAALGCIGLILTAF